jgi:hypothetical protein
MSWDGFCKTASSENDRLAFSRQGRAASLLAHQIVYKASQNGRRPAVGVPAQFPRALLWRRGKEPFSQVFLACRIDRAESVV